METRGLERYAQAQIRRRSGALDECLFPGWSIVDQSWSHVMWFLGPSDCRAWRKGKAIAVRIAQRMALAAYAEADHCLAGRHLPSFDRLRRSDSASRAVDLR